MKEEEKRIEKEQAAKAQNWKLPVCYDDEDDEDRSISLKDNIISGLPSCAAIIPISSTEEPDNSLSMRDEHLDTVPATESDEFIKSSVESLVSIQSESEGILENMCDMPFHDNYPLLDVSEDQFKDFSDSNDESTLIDDDSFSIDNIEYVEASPPNSELVSSEISSRSTTTHSDSSLYDSFIFDRSINSFPPNDRSDFYEFVDELTHIISPPEYDCFCFKDEPNLGDFTMDVVEDSFLT
nr:hypothetical protein [Tanacetum cinerariifolium]